MQELESQLAEGNDRIAAGARSIERLQEKIKRLQSEGKDISEARRLLGRYHELQLQIVAEQEQLRQAIAAAVNRTTGQ